MSHDNYPNDYIRAILQSVKTIALVGASQNPARPSWIVMKYLLDRGYDVIPINPGLAGGELPGKKVYGKLSEVPGPIDMVEIFRNSAAAGPITDEALGLNPLPKGDLDAALRPQRRSRRPSRSEGHSGRDGSLPEDRVDRLSGEISRQGVNSRILSAKKPVLAGKGFRS